MLYTAWHHQYTPAFHQHSALKWSERRDIKITLFIITLRCLQRITKRRQRFSAPQEQRADIYHRSAQIPHILFEISSSVGVQYGRTFLFELLYFCFAMVVV
jgi:hypothetical protein